MIENQDSSKDSVYCQVDFCYNVKSTSGECNGHAQQRRQGKVYTLLPRKQMLEPWNYPICAFGGCGRPVDRSELCAAHYAQDNRGEELRPIRKHSWQKGDTCSFPGCDREKQTNDLCGSHWSQMFKHGRTWELNLRFPCPVPDCEGVFTRTSRSMMCKRHLAAARRYGLTNDELIALYSNNPECAACGSTEDLHIDHDHACCPVGNGIKCGKCVRGLLCRRCNHLLGHAQDSIELLEGAIRYLQSAR